MVEKSTFWGTVFNCQFLDQSNNQPLKTIPGQLFKAQKLDLNLGNTISQILIASPEKIGKVYEGWFLDLA